MGEHGVTVVFGGQLGSEGKGAIAGYLARRHPYQVAIHNFMPNAGHTWVPDDGDKVVVRQLPMALVNPDIPFLLIGPGAAIDVDVLLGEIQKYDSEYGVAARLGIDTRAVIVEAKHAEMGAEHSIARAGTGKGCGRANAAKSMRLPDVQLARDIPQLREFLTDTVDIVNDTVDRGHPVLVEAAQGFDLDINHGLSYPFCTSRGTTPMQVLADCGLAPSTVTRSIAVVRTYPIRVGNIVIDDEQVGYSGSYPGEELTWRQVEKLSGAPAGSLMERTTVTNRVRRVFKPDFIRLVRMGRVCRPTEIAVTFADYLDYGARDWNYNDIEHFPAIKEFAHLVEGHVLAPVTMIKTGERDGSMIRLPRMRPTV